MHDANPLWGAPRIHRDLLKLGIKDGNGRGDPEHILVLARDTGSAAAQPEGAAACRNFDPSLTVLPWPLSLDVLANAINGDGAAQEADQLGAVGAAA